ncbi:hypothetical protein ONA91_16415 [Micromonospora sp. DR5-3]|uniref:hypothetical protein n=1 Tax=unclassified Micromonospora TaxID=2617518 RepID=UPI0011D9E7D8|nr:MULTISPECIES: hypothetical protein [unclassified Micromonospora]MCW3816027.1 hypothetical protein [Micromonospora sp. DR5-3]TYC21292.1 hypothetical protein FXF52_26870 [Micromonospora sp. MP36]
MPTHYILRVQTRPELDPERTAAQLVQIARDTGADEICMFAFAEERNDGHPSLDEVRRWCEHTRPARAALAEAGVRISINPWATLLHVDRGRRLRPDQPWQTLVDPYGRATQAQVCPLDPGWRAYYREVLRRYASEEHVGVVWVEDDIRLHNHAPLRWGGCFCPLHLERFARRIGRVATRQEVIAACTADGVPHPWRAQWLDMWDEAQVELIAEWREIVVPLGRHLGLMSSQLSEHSAEGRRWDAWFGALDPDGTPVHRPHFWPYSSGTPDQLPAAVVRLDAARSVQPTAVRSFPEIENYPYGRWNKSFREMFAQMALAHVLGSAGLAISVHDFMGNEPTDEPMRAAFLAQARPALDLIADLFPPALRSTGVGIPWSPHVARHRAVPAGEHGRWEALAAPVGGIAPWLIAAGTAVSLRGEGRVNALPATMVDVATAEDVHRWLSGGVLLDGPAALGLQARGYGRLIGLTDARWISQGHLPFSIERCTRADFGLRQGCDISVNQSAGSCLHCLVQGTLAPGAQPASVLLDASGNPVGHGLVLFENELGGRVAILPWSMEASVSMNEQRAAQLAKTVDWLGDHDGAGPEHLAVSGHPWLIPIALTDGERWRVAVFNASPDDATAFAVRLPAGMPSPAGALHVTGTGRLAPATLVDGEVRTVQPMRQWELVLLSSSPIHG